MLEFIAAKAEYFSGLTYVSEGQKFFADFNIMGIDFIEFSNRSMEILASLHTQSSITLKGKKGCARRFKWRDS